MKSESGYSFFNDINAFKLFLSSSTSTLVLVSPGKGGVVVSILSDVGDDLSCEKLAVFLHESLLFLAIPRDIAWCPHFALVISGCPFHASLPNDPF